MHRTVSRIRTAYGRWSGTMRAPTRYDLVLAVIPVAFLAAAVVGLTSSVSPTAAIGAAAALSAVPFVDVLFLNPPREPSARRPPG